MGSPTPHVYGIQKSKVAWALFSTSVPLISLSYLFFISLSAQQVPIILERPVAYFWNDPPGGARVFIFFSVCLTLLYERPDSLHPRLSLAYL